MNSDALSGLDPDQLIRATERNGKKYFGYGHSQIAALIAQGALPAPFALYEGAAAKFWTGAQIRSHHLARQAARAAALSDRPPQPKQLKRQHAGAGA
jgi:hypothetical protein